MSSDLQSEPSLVIKGVSKRYRVAGPQPSTAAEAMISRVKRGGRGPSTSNFTALSDINLRVERGEVLGIVGHNGAGKSTLLKILSRITEPSEGRIEIYGRVGALLEVGTGFHPELTGRENVFLNGRIIGMSHDEVRRQFDDIVDFSGVEKFLDVPVKRYSSGMSVRLAFAVASSLRSDVLIVDEVLAVGDAQFQAKCMGRMADVAAEGRTVLFVSHNLAAVQALCTRAVLLERGRLISDALPATIIHQYLERVETSGRQASPGVSQLSLTPEGGVRPHLVQIKTVPGGRAEPSDTAVTGGGVTFEILVKDMDQLTQPHVGLSFSTETGTLVATATTQMSGVQGFDEDPGLYRLNIPDLPLLPGRYWIDVGVRESGSEIYLDLATRATNIDVLGADVYGTGVIPSAGEGLVYLRHQWSKGRASYGKL